MVNKGAVRKRDVNACGLRIHFVYVDKRPTDE
jgi:hypothetical protein